MKLWIMIVAMLVALAASAYADPVGGNVTQVSPSQRMIIQNSSTSINAMAGNMTELQVNGQRVTKYWQGFYGNVSGNLMLGTPDGANLYNWGQGAVSGEIYASRNSSRINWTAVGCPNTTQVQNEDTYLDANPLFSRDSLNQTFNFTTHPSFEIGGRAVAGCRSTPVNGNPGVATDFWNVFLTDNGTSLTTIDDISIYAAVIDPDTAGFNSATYDFQMLVGERGNGSEEFPSGTSTTYFFYVELS